MVSEPEGSGNLVQLESLVGRLGYTFDDAGLKAAQRELAATARANTELTEGHKAGAAWAEQHSAKLAAGAVVAGTFAAAGAGVVAVLGDSVAAAKEYQATLAQVSTLSPEAAARTKEYGQEILKVSSALGTDAVDSANALYDALSSGVPPENAIAFMTTASKAAIAGATDTGTAVTGLNAVINAWGLSAADAGKVGDTFFQGVNLGVMRFEDLAGSIGQVAPLASSLGVDFDQVAAATAKLTKGGLTAAQAITQQRAAMVALITPNKEMEAILGDVALANEDVARYAEENGVSTGKAMLATLGYQGSMEALRTTADGTGANMEKALGSVEAIGAVFGLTGDNANEARQFLDQMNSSAGATEQAFGKVAETTEFKWGKFTASINNAQIALGQGLLPVISLVLDAVTPLAEGAVMVATAFGELPTPVKALVAGLAVLVTVGAGVVAVGAGLAAAFGPAIVAMGGLGAVAAGIGAAWAGASATIVAGAGAAVAALLPLIAPLIAITAVVLSLKKGHDDYAASLDKSFQATKVAGGGLNDYIAATKKAQESTSGLGKVWSQLGSNAGLDLQSSTQAWLKYGVGVDEAVLKTDKFTEAQQKAGEEWRKTGDVEAYKDAMLAAADAASVTAGKGHILTGEQKEQADAFGRVVEVLVQRSGAAADALAQDEKLAAVQQELSQQVGLGKITQEQAVETINSYVGARSKQIAEDEKAAQAAANAAQKTASAMSQQESSVTMYSKALQGLSGGSAVSFTPGAELDKDSQKKLDKANEDARQSQAEHLSGMYASRVEYQGKLQVLLDAGKTEEAAKLTATYEEEEGKQAAHLAQLALNQLNSLLTMGQVSEGQAQLIYGSLASAFPGSELFDASAQATMEWSGQLGQAFAGNEEAAAGLGTFLTTRLPAAFDEGGASALAYKDNSIEAFQATQAAGDTSSAALVDADQAVIISGLQRMQAAGESLTAEQQHLLDTAGVAQSTSDKTITAFGGVGKGAKGMGTDVAAGVGTAKTEVATLPGAVTTAAGQIKSGFGDIGTAVASAGKNMAAGQREGLMALEETLSRQGSAMSASAEFGATGEATHHRVASSVDAGAKSMDQFSTSATTAYTKTVSAQKEVEEQTGRVETALKKVPKELLVKTELPQYPRFMSQMDSIIKKIKEIDNAAMHAARSIQAIIDKRGEAGGAGGGGAGGGSAPGQPRPTGTAESTTTADSVSQTTSYGDAVNYVGDAYGYATEGASAWGEAADYATHTSAQAMSIMDEAIAKLDAWTATEPDWNALWAGIYRPFLEQAPTAEGSIAWMINQWRDGSILGSAMDDPKFAAQVQLIEASFARINQLVASGDFENAKREWAILYARIKEQEDRRHKDVLDHLDAQAEPLDDQIKALRRAGEASGDSERYEKQIHALEMAKEAIADLKDKEDDRHKAAMRHLDDQNRAVQDGQQQQKEWLDEQDRRQKAASDAIKAEQKAYVDAENDAHTQVMRQIDDEAERRKGLHESILTDIEDRKRIEAEAFQTSAAALDTAARIIKDGVDATSRALAGMRLEMDQAKLDLDIDGEQAKLKSLTDDVSKFKDTLGKLERVETDPKKARDEERKRQAERVKLTTDAQREMLAKHRAMANAEDQRTIDLMLAGYNVRATDAERIMGGIQSQLQGQADSQQGVVDAKQAQLDKMQQAIDKAEILAKVEKQAADDQLKVIEELKRKNSEAHTEFVRQIDAEKRIEDVRYKAEAQAITDLKKQEQERHADRIKNLNEQYALELLRLGKSEEEVARIILEQEAQAKRVSEEADKRYRAAIALIDAEAKRIEAEATARETSVREKAETMRRELIERLRAILLVVGGDAAKAVDELLQKLLDPTFGIPGATDAFVKMGEAGVRAFVRIGEAIKLVTKSIGEPASGGGEEDAGVRDPGHWALPRAKLNASTKRGAGGFRFGSDVSWAAWHRRWVVDPLTAGPEPPGGPPGAGAGAPPPPPPLTGRKQLPWEPPLINAAHNVASAMLNDWINPVNEGLTEMNAQLAALGLNLSTLAPNFGGVTGGWTGGGKGNETIDYHHYGDNVFVGDKAAEDFLIGLHMAP